MVSELTRAQVKNMAAKKVLEFSRGKQAHNKCKTEKRRCKSNSVAQTKFSNCEERWGRRGE
jgi:hypothetical protein